MKIQVTAEHILKGNCGSETSCPVALAIKDACPEIERLEVDSRNICAIGWSRMTPEHVSKFVRIFDTYHARPPELRFHRVEPFEFELDIP